MNNDIPEEVRRKITETAHSMRSAGLNTLDYIEHFGYFLYLKLLDEQEHQQEKADPTYQTRLGDDKWRFHHWVQREHDLPSFVRELFRHLGRLPSRPGVENWGIRTIFYGTYPLLRDPERLRQLLDVVQMVSLQEHGDDIGGRVFDFLLSNMARDSEELAQSFTQRHLVDLMVRLVDPQLGKKIYDPTSGTGGFLVRSYEHLRDKLSPDDPDYEEKLHLLQQKTIYGREINLRVHKLGVMNMLLHGDGHNQLLRGNSLDEASQMSPLFDFIFANPPFGSIPLLEQESANFPVSARSAELLFIQHVMLQLAPGGRAAIVVPESTLFRGGQDQEVRELLLRDCSVEAVISLPPSTFLPYTSVKPSIVIFRKGGPTKRVWFFEVRNNGVERTASRHPIPGNDDLDVLIELWDTKPETNQSWWADLDHIAQMDYALSASRYRSSQIESGPYRWVRLGELLSHCREIITIVDDKLYKRIKVKSQSEGVELRDEVYGYEIRTKAQQKARGGQVVVSAIGAKDGAYGVIPAELDGAIVSTNYHLYEIVSRNVLAEYIAFALSHKSIREQLQPYVRGLTRRARVNAQDFLDLRIPLPPIERQQTVVARLEEVKSEVEQALQRSQEVRQEIKSEIFEA